MFGLGAQEILLLLILAGAVAIAVAAVLAFSGRGRRVSDLEAENRQLREDNDRLRGKS